MFKNWAHPWFSLPSPCSDDFKNITGNRNCTPETAAWYCWLYNKLEKHSCDMESCCVDANHVTIGAMWGELFERKPAETRLGLDFITDLGPDPEKCWGPTTHTFNTGPLRNMPINLGQIHWGPQKVQLPRPSFERTWTNVWVWVDNMQNADLKLGVLCDLGWVSLWLKWPFDFRNS